MGRARGSRGSLGRVSVDADDGGGGTHGGDAGDVMLLLIPTELEARALLDQGTSPTCEDAVDAVVGGRRVRAALCGFGPAAAAALAARTLARERPSRVLLVGLGGTYDERRLPVGGLLAADRVVFGDLGVSRGGRFLGPRELGFAQAPAAPGRRSVEADLTLADPAGAALAPTCVRGTLVTVASVSSTATEAAARSARVPGALLEDMEGFGVALAAQREDVRCSIVRAASNRAGDPDRGAWKLPESLAVLRRWLVGALEVVQREGAS
jgi:futalosine hydrolase